MFSPVFGFNCDFMSLNYFPFSDFFVLKASDRQLFSADVIVEAVALPDGEIKLVRNKPLTVVAGQIIFFSRNNIDITSEVPPENVTLTILTGE